ncbi:MAG TPA: CHRD domain-containing protein [Allosphingosinicella sp.]
MRMDKGILTGMLALAAGLAAAPAQAEMLTFHVSLDGKFGNEPTGSPATGTAKVKVDTERKLVSVDMKVEGLTDADLWDKLVAAPIGPIHFHRIPREGADAELALPLPYGPNYHFTKTGMTVTMKDYDYTAGAALLKSTLSFDDFVAAMRGGEVVLNIHTDKFNPGEISGKVVEGPAGGKGKA